MKEMALEYDNVCYLDFDVIPNTKDDIFKAHKIDTHFACAENNSSSALTISSLMVLSVMLKSHLLFS